MAKKSTKRKPVKQRDSSIEAIPVATTSPELLVEVVEEEGQEAPSTEVAQRAGGAPMPVTPAIEEPVVEDEQVVQKLPVAQHPQGERREIVKSASLVMLGNLGSSVMGMVRQIVVAAAGNVVAGAFLAALTPAQSFYDFLINGSVSGALIPTFNDYSAPDKRDELRRIVFTIVNLVIIVTVAVSILFFFIAPWLFNTFLAGGYQSGSKVLTLQFAQIIFFSLIALAPFSVLLAALYALKEFGWPAFATVSYHLGIIVGAIVGALIGRSYFGNYGLAVGVVVGALGEIALLIPGMRNQRFGYMFVLDLQHPALRRILKLYAPVSFSFLISMGLVFFDQFLATSTPCAAFMHTHCGEANFSAMKLATTLIQFPIGLVAAALSFAVLPTLTTHVREGNTEQFKATLQLGFRLGLLLMIPAAAGLIVLQTPIVRTIFEHHNFDQQTATLTAMALQNYAYQLPFVAMDQLLIAAFYARKNTIIPVVVLMVSILGYLAVALPFWHTIGMPALAFANTVQNSLHAIILLVVLRAAIGPINIRPMIPTVLKILLATAVMVAVAWGLQAVMGHVQLFSLNTFLGQLSTVVIAGGLAAAAYFAVALVLKVEEVGLLKGVVLAKLGRK
ncbi:MAG TPA: lipid II flippase MurJ [Ktedonobacteraceae bacterium]|nr:lipid II flippase MurJ [Ktedonobacteraceae bacterium]